MISDLTAEKLRELFSYSPETGQFVRLTGRCAGRVAGDLSDQGYLRISIGRRNYRCHRLAWLWMTGEWPPNQVDHRDGDRTNNRWKNLRTATPAQNAQNRDLHSRAKSGLRGVYWREDTRCWFAEIMAHGRSAYLGSFDAPEAAHAAYLAAAREQFGEFARAA